MDVMVRVENALERALLSVETAACPPSLAAAMRYSVIPGGARIRPKLCLAVARACTEDSVLLTDAAASSIELLHCASLVHDDLPCFDDAAMRRGKPSVHAAFGQPLAVLAGDALIVLAFETLARQAAQHPDRLAELILIVSRAVGAPTGIVAGQAWECEDALDLAEYHREKTGSLFVAATMAGAAATGAKPEPWRALGDLIGEAFQVADDIRDVLSTPEEIGKPVGRDEALGRPNAVRELGIPGAVKRLEHLLKGAKDSIPTCPGAKALKAIVEQEASLFLPKKLLQRIAA